MNKYVSIDDIVDDDKYPFTKGQLRNFIAKRKENGLAISIRKIGRRIYIREDLFLQWIESHSDSVPVEKKVKMKNTKIEDMGFSVRTLNCLKSSNIKTLEKLKNTRISTLKKIQHLGSKSIEEIQEQLAPYGCYLK